MSESPHESEFDGPELVGTSDAYETDVQIETLEARFESSEYTQSIEAFDAVQEELLDTIAVLFTEPKDRDQLDALLLVAAELVRKFSTCVELINKDKETTDTDVRIASVLQLLIGEDNKRQEFFASIAPCDEYADHAYDRDIARRMIEDTYGEQGTLQEIQKQLTETFAYGLQEDIKHILSHLPEVVAEDSELTKTDVMRLVGKTALDVAKIGLGVAGGIIVASRYLSRRKG